MLEYYMLEYYMLEYYNLGALYYSIAFNIALLLILF